MPATDCYNLGNCGNPCSANDLAQLFPGSGQVNKPAIVVHGSNSAVRISRLHGPHFKSDTLKIVDDPRNRKPIFRIVLNLNIY